MLDESKNLTTRVAVRITNEKYEKINSILDDGLYSQLSKFFRCAVDLLLFWENKIELNDVVDSNLRKSIRSRFAKDKNTFDTFSMTIEDLTITK